MNHLVISPCCNPTLPLETALKVYTALGYTQFEVFTSWAASAVDLAASPEAYRDLGRRYGMTFRSMHLPPVEENNLQETVRRAIEATRFARALGTTHVIFKANSRPAYITAAKPYLDAIVGWGVTPVLQNHRGMAISSLEDFQEVIAGIDDPRMQTLLEVGQFLRAGVAWQDGFELLAARSTIGLVHFRDSRDGKDVPFGAGDVDMLHLFRLMRGIGYSGAFVVELEMEGSSDAETLHHLGEARVYAESLLKEAGYA